MSRVRESGEYDEHCCDKAKQRRVVALGKGRCFLLLIKMKALKMGE